MYTIIIGAVIGLILWILTKEGIGVLLLLFGAIAGMLIALSIGAINSSEYTTKEAILVDMNQGPGETYVQGTGNIDTGLTYTILIRNEQGELETRRLPRERAVVKKNDAMQALVLIRQDTSRIFTTWSLHGQELDSYEITIPSGTFEELASLKR